MNIINDDIKRALEAIYSVKEDTITELAPDASDAAGPRGAQAAAAHMGQDANLKGSFNAKSFGALLGMDAGEAMLLNTFLNKHKQGTPPNRNEIMAAADVFRALVDADPQVTNQALAMLRRVHAQAPAEAVETIDVQEANAPTEKVGSIIKRVLGDRLTWNPGISKLYKDTRRSKTQRIDDYKMKNIRVKIDGRKSDLYSERGDPLAVALRDELINAGYALKGGVSIWPYEVSFQVRTPITISGESIAESLRVTKEGVEECWGDMMPDAATGQGEPMTVNISMPNKQISVTTDSADEIMNVLKLAGIAVGEPAVEPEAAMVGAPGVTAPESPESGEEDEGEGDGSTKKGAIQESSSDLREIITDIFEKIYRVAADGDDPTDIIADQLGDYFEAVQNSGDKTLQRAYKMVRDLADAENEDQYDGTLEAILLLRDDKGSTQMGEAQKKEESVNPQGPAVEEQDAFTMAAAAAAREGKSEFEFPEGSGKMHPVKIGKDTAAKMGESEEVEEDAAGGDVYDQVRAMAKDYYSKPENQPSFSQKNPSFMDKLKARVDRGVAAYQQAKAQQAGQPKESAELASIQAEAIRILKLAGLDESKFANAPADAEGEAKVYDKLPSAPGDGGGKPEYGTRQSNLGGENPMALKTLDIDMEESFQMAMGEYRKFVAEDIMRKESAGQGNTKKIIKEDSDQEGPEDLLAAVDEEIANPGGSIDNLIDVLNATIDSDTSPQFKKARALIGKYVDLVTNTDVDHENEFGDIAVQAMTHGDIRKHIREYDLTDYLQHASAMLDEIVGSNVKEGVTKK